MLNHIILYSLYCIHVHAYNYISLEREGGGGEINTVIIQNNYSFIKIYISINT